MSFTAIQLSQAQAEQEVTPSKKDKRSLLQIQEEERARQAEEEFLRWWSAEEERVKAEELATEALLAAGPPKKPRKPKAPNFAHVRLEGAPNGAAKGGGGDRPTSRQHHERPPKAQAQGEGQGQGGKPRRRRPQGPGKDDGRKQDSQPQT